MYSLRCASPLAKLYKLDTTEVDHFELLDDNRKLIFSAALPQGKSSRRKGDATEILRVRTPASFNVTHGIGNVM